MHSRRRHPGRWAFVLLLTLGLALPHAASGASSVVGVSALIPSATNVSVSACPSWTTNTTAFGDLLPGASVATSNDCTVTFGSSDDTSMLKVSQSDRSGIAFFRSAEGELDTAWDADGLLDDDINGSEDDFPVAFTVQVATGKPLVLSHVSNGTDTDIVLSRYTTAGVLDATWGTAGRVTIDLGQSEAPMSIVENADGTFWVLGSKGTGLNTDGLLIKLTSSGGMTTWDSDGWRTYNLSGWEQFESLTRMNDGSLLLKEWHDTGFSLTALTKIDAATGDPIGSFGTDGTYHFTATRGKHCTSVVEQVDGTILCVGYLDPTATNKDVYVARLTANGALDVSFDTDGEVTYSPGGAGVSDDRINGIVMLPSGSMLLAGKQENSTLIMKLTAGGALDTSFDGDGWSATTLGGASGSAAIGLRPTGSGGYLILGIGSWAGGHSEAYMGRLTSTLTWDPAVNSGAGYRRIDLGPSHATSQITAFIEGIDGTVYVGAMFQEGDWGGTIARIQSYTVPDYVETATDWNDGGGMFGMCARAVSAATADWTISATCPQTDGTYWRGVPITAGTAGSKVAHAANAVTNASVSFRFGLRTTATQKPGVYAAPIAFDVLAPNL